MKKIFTLCLFFLLAITVQAQIRYLKGILQGSQEVPAVASSGGGVVIVKYDMATKTLELIGNYSGLTDTISNSHIHRGPAGVSGPVIVPLANTGLKYGKISGKAVVSQGFEDSLLLGNAYANVHSKAFPGGELRAQLTTTTLGQTEIFTGRVQGAQQVPPNASTATGSVTAILDKTTLEVFVTADYHKLADSATASHIHRQPVGLAGPVIVGLFTTRDTSGTSWGNTTVSSSFADSMIAGNTYYNIHNKPFPGGEIRAQLIKASQIRFLATTLQGSQQVPSTNSLATGTVIAKYNTDTKILEVTGDYQNISAAVNNSHIHAPTPAGSNATALIPLNNTGGTSGVMTGTVTLNAADESNLLGGLMYINVHDASFPDGEIGGTLMPTTAGETQYFTNTLSASQQVPVNSSAATGKVTVILDKATNKVFLTGNFSNLDSAASAGHIHRGLTGTNGPVIVPLSVTMATFGTITGSATVSGTFADSMIRGFTYVNIHNSTHPGGEIRTQLGDLVLPVKLEYFNGYKDQNKVVVFWQSAQELNVKHYEVEQQNEAGEWIKKGTVAATGGSSAMKYRFDDLPLIGKKDFVLYRLKTVDLNGLVTYSSVIRINYSRSQAALTIMQNPVINGNLVLTVTGLVNEQKAEMSIIDFTGRLIKKNIMSTLSNNVIDINNLSKGMYKVVVKFNDIVLQQSFSKQ